MSASPAIYLRLDPHSGEPIYQQVVEQIKYRVACGQLDAGAQLPSIRTLADQLKVNPRTVVKAYEELEHAGLVVTKQGQGVFVSARRDVVPTSARRRTIAEMARRLLAEAARMGAEAGEVMAIIKAEAEEMEPEK